MEETESQAEGYKCTWENKKRIGEVDIYRWSDVAAVGTVQMGGANEL